MLLHHFIFISLLLLPSTYSCANKNFVKKHECLDLHDEKKNEEICVLNEVPKMFYPVNLTPFSVIEVLVNGSILPVVNSTMCQAFPNLEKLQVSGQQVNIVDPNAFVLCTRLRHLHLAGNEIKALDPGTFRMNKRLTHIWLYKNKLKELDPELFVNQRYLEFLYLSNNELESFSSEVFKHLRNLKLLVLHNNELEDLDAEGIVSAMPYLREVQLRFNPFDCHRLKVILRIFEEHNIWLRQNGGEKDKYEYAYEKGFECARKEIQKKIYVKVCGCVIKEGPNAGKRKCTMQARNITVLP